MRDAKWSQGGKTWLLDSPRPCPRPAPAFPLTRHKGVPAPPKKGSFEARLRRAGVAREQTQRLMLAPAFPEGFVHAVPRLQQRPSARLFNIRSRPHALSPPPEPSPRINDPLSLAPLETGHVLARSDRLALGVEALSHVKSDPDSVRHPRPQPLHAK